MKKFAYPLIAALVIGLDQITKYMVRRGMTVGERIPYIGDWASINYVQNTGTAFSMFEGNKLITIALTSVLIIVCIVYAVHEIRDSHRITAVLLTLISAGGFSNMIDRVALGYVTDMLSFGRFAVFNVADIAVTCSSILMIIVLFFVYKEEKETGSADDWTESDE